MSRVFLIFFYLGIISVPAVVLWGRVLQPFTDDIKHLLNNLYCFIEHQFEVFCQ